MQYLHGLAYIAIVLLIGTLASVLAYGLKTSDVFILLLTGMLFNHLGLLSFNQEIIIIMSILALIFVVFNSTIKINLKEIKKYFIDAINLNFTYFILCILFLSPAYIFIYNTGSDWKAIMLSVLFAVLAYGTDPTVVLSTFKSKKNKILEMIEIESIINTPITVVLGLMILSLIGGTKFSLIEQAGNTLILLSLSIIVAVLFSFFAGWLIIQILKRAYLGELTHLAVATTAIITYVGTEYLGGSGVLAIAIFGLLFGNSHIKHLIEIERFESILSNGIKILTFMFLGTILIISEEYIIKGTLLFIIYLIIRFISVEITFRSKNINMKKKIFMTINVPKGVDIAVLILIINSFHQDILNIDILINNAMIILLYSIALSTIAGQFSKYFLGKKSIKKISR